MLSKLKMTALLLLNSLWYRWPDEKAFAYDLISGTPPSNHTKLSHLPPHVQLKTHQITFPLYYYPNIAVDLCAVGAFQGVQIEEGKRG
jgi:hypothetical protein